MAPERQIEATRNNALKSTGPIPEEGKARVAQNGSRYRKLPETVLLQSENPERFMSCRRNLCAARARTEAKPIDHLVCD